MQKQRMRNQKGFTLVEIAIVLVIVGLLIGGILKGQEMIKSGKLKKTSKQIEQLQASISAYQDKKGGALPTGTNVLTTIAGEGLIAYNATDKMWNAYGGEVTAANSGGVVTITSKVIPDMYALEIDKAMDDGDGTSGSIKLGTGTADYASKTSPSSTGVDLNIVY